MKIFLSVLFLSFNLLSFETNVSELHNYIKEKSVKGKLSKRSVKGTWYSTYHQQQVYPSGCYDHKDNIKLELYSTRENLEITPSKSRRLGPVLDLDFNHFPMSGGQGKIINGAIKVGSFSGGPFEGNFDYYCTLLDTFKKAKGKKVLMCFNPYNDFSDFCGWYSFFVRE